MGKMYNFISFFISNYINFITHIFHPKSIKKLFFKSFLFLILLFCILFIGSSFYFSSIMRRQVYETMKETMNLYNEQLQQRFQETLTYLSENCLQNTDIAIMNTTSDLNERYVRIARLKKHCQPAPVPFLRLPVFLCISLILIFTFLRSAISAIASRIV